MEVRARMTPDPATVTPRDTLAKAKALMHAGGFRCLPVVEGVRLVGIITERDLRQHLGYLDTTRVDGAMASKPLTAPPSCSVQDAARLLLQHKVGALPVVEKGGGFVGIITTSDLLKALLDVIEASQAILED